MGSIEYLEAMFGLGRDQEHIAVPAKAEAKLLEMAARLVGTDDMIAIYIPEGTEDVYQVGNRRGRVVGAVKLIAMPADRTIHDYYFEDLATKERRWPVGWPCKVVFYPPESEAPVLRALVETLHGFGNFQPYVGGLQNGPKSLDGKMKKKLFEMLSRYPVA